jgi:hypothetical protein
MKTFGKSVRLYLNEGIVTEIKFFELVNWTIQGLVCPRSRIGELKNWPESQRPGVYVLLGDDETGEFKFSAYIGESEDVFDRLKTHLNQSDFDFKEVVLFTCKDANLTKAHVRNLEGKLYKRAVIANRYKIKNGQEPSESPLPRPDEEAMKEFAENVYLLLGTLGHLLFEPVITSAKSPDKEKVKFGSLHFDLPNLDIHATGLLTDEGFLVCKDSTAVAKAADSLQGGYKEIRDELIKSSILVPSGEKLVFEKDYMFNSPSAAATVVAGSPRSGNVTWKDASGKILKEIEAS